MIYLLENVYKNNKGEYCEANKIGYCLEAFEAARKFAYDTHNYGYEFLGEHNGTRRDENRLHWLFREDLLRGEWFRSSPELKFIFNHYTEENWDSIKSFYSLVRECPITKIWAQALRVPTDEWLNFLWDLAENLFSLGMTGEKKLYDFPVWSGPEFNNYMPPRKILREALGRIQSRISNGVLEFVQDVPRIEINLFSSQFLLSLSREYCLPCYPWLFREYCLFLDENGDRSDVRNQFYDPRPKLLYETMGTGECEKENFNLEKLWEKLQSINHSLYPEKILNHNQVCL